MITMTLLMQKRNGKLRELYKVSVNVKTFRGVD